MLNICKTIDRIPTSVHHWYVLKIILAFNPTKVAGSTGRGGGGPPENHFYTSPDATGLLIKFIWAHINHAAKTF